MSSLGRAQQVAPHGFGAPQFRSDWFAVGSEPHFVADVDGDQLADLITFVPSNGSVYVARAISGGAFQSSFVAKTGFGVAGRTALVGDFSGDGSADILSIAAGTSGTANVASSNLGTGGSGFGTVSNWRSGMMVSGDVIIPADMNLDGRDDLVIFRQSVSDVLVSISTGASFGAPSVWHTNFAGSGCTPLVLPQVLGNLKPQVASRCGTTISRLSQNSAGTAFNTTPISSGTAPSTAGQGHPPVVADVTGDAASDIVFFINDEIHVAAARTASPYFDSARPWSVARPATGRTFQFGHLNNDIKADLVQFTPTQPPGQPATAVGDVWVSLTHIPEPVEDTNLEAQLQFGWYQAGPQGVSPLGVRPMVVAVVDFTGVGNDPITRTTQYFQEFVFGPANQASPLIPNGRSVNSYYRAASHNQFEWSNAGVSSMSLPAVRAGYLSFRTAGYVNAAPTDIGKTVIGASSGNTAILEGYDNANRIWTLRFSNSSPTPFQVPNESIYIANGVGSGAALPPSDWNSSTSQYTLRLAANGYTAPHSQNDIGKVVVGSLGSSGTLIAVDNAARTWTIQSSFASWKFASVLETFTVTSSAATGVARAPTSRDTNAEKWLIRGDVIERLDADGFNFTQYDLNFDGSITDNELSLLIFDNNSAGGGCVRSSGCVSVDGGTKTYCANYSGAAGHRVSYSTLVHEVGHMIDAPDMYGANGYNAGATIMGPTTGPDDYDALERPDAYNLTRWGWLRPRVYRTDSPSFVTAIAPAQEPQSEWGERSPLLIYDPTVGEHEYFLVEERRWSYGSDDWSDKWLGGSNSQASGILAWRVVTDGFHRQFYDSDFPYASITAQSAQGLNGLGGTSVPLAWATNVLTFNNGMPVFWSVYSTRGATGAEYAFGLFNRGTAFNGDRMVQVSSSYRAGTPSGQLFSSASRAIVGSSNSTTVNRGSTLTFTIADIPVNETGYSVAAYPGRRSATASFTMWPSTSQDTSAGRVVTVTIPANAPVGLHRFAVPDAGGLSAGQHWTLTIQ